VPNMVDHRRRGNDQQPVRSRSKMFQGKAGLAARRRTRDQEIQIPTIRQDAMDYFLLSSPN
jgi:plasmid stabilization system protein ParE